MCVVRPLRCALGKPHKCSEKRERKMRTNFVKNARELFLHKLFEHPQGSGTSRQIPGTSQAPPFQTRGKQTFEGGHELFDHHPYAWKTPTPPGGLWTQKVNLCALFSCLREPSGRPGVPGTPVRFPTVNNCYRKSLGHRPVDNCLSHRLSKGHPADVPEDFLKFMCLFQCKT